ncbi:MAG: PKD domain-containing protein [Bacteroidetes bacterium]|nr:PKD domain-containing protein [Bacteroidota bacterium]
MKRLSTLMLFVLTALSFKSKAQTTCNADFNFSISAFTVQFTPVMVGDSINTVHYWNFGDGGVLSAVAPLHTYSASGSYNVKHYMVRHNANGTITCTDSVTKVVTIPPTTACNLQAYFTYNADSLNWNTIHFFNQSLPNAPGDSIRWNFGDGSAPINGLVGSLSTPTHVYANAGVYNVCIRVKKNVNATATPCISEICKTVIVAPACILSANFSWTNVASSPLTLAFQNLSVPLTPGDSIRWTFGDGSVSYDINPTHTFTQPGIYTVCLRVKKNITVAGVPPCVSEICKTVTVSNPCNLVANFTSQPDSSHPLRIKFTNTSTPVSATDSVRWTFGDGTSVSGVQGDPNIANPTHDYAMGGLYTVCIRVKKNDNATGTAPCVREFCKTVFVQTPCNFTVSFTIHRDSVNHNLVYFTNTTLVSTATATAIWHFGDGTSATTWNAAHVYTQPGSYRVCLTVMLNNATNCVREYCDSVIILPPPPTCEQLSQFTFVKAPNDNQKFTFTPNFIETTTLYTWTFGDGTGSHDPIAVHRYAQPGLYTACLTAWRSATCATTTCKEVRVLPQVNCDSIHVSYVYQRDPVIPNKVYFYANANATILDQTWTITKLAPATTPPVILHQNNPVYVFQDTGYYNVCLKAITSGGCVKEYCSVIHIEHVASTVCELQATPNPATTAVSVNVILTTPGMIDAYVYNSMNVLVKEKHQSGIAGTNTVTLSIGDLVAGIYTIKLVYGGKVCYARFTKM